MTIQEFINKWNGKPIDFDGYYGYQCVDLYRQYVKEVLNLPQSPGVEGAKDIWNSYLKEHFDLIENDPNAVPKLGDIIIWNSYAGNGYGHVAIFNSGDVNGFISFDQNWPVNSYCHLQSHNYTNVLGWLRPKKAIDSTPDCEFTPQTLIPIGGEWGEMELQAVRSTLNDQKQDIDNLTLDLENCRKNQPKTLEFKNNVAKLLYNIALSLEGK